VRVLEHRALIAISDAILLAHRTAQQVGAAERVAGQALRHLHHLFLVDESAVGRLQHDLHIRMQYSIGAWPATRSAGADLLRRAMGKKIASEMASQARCSRTAHRPKGIEPQTASAVFDLMEKFANYGFNKSHAAAYALVSYQTAWLKAHYPAEIHGRGDVGGNESHRHRRDQCWPSASACA